MCGHAHYTDGTYDTPPEFWCDLGYTSCDNTECEYYHSEEDMLDEAIDMAYDNPIYDQEMLLC